MVFIFWIVFVGIMCFGFVLIFGAPYLPVHTSAGNDSLDLLNLKKGDKLYELGCGDGKMLLMAERRGLIAVGYELNPLLYILAKIRTYRYKNIYVKYGNFWVQNLSDADGVFVFLLDRFMKKLDRKLSSELRPGTCLASYTFKIPNKKIKKQKNGVYLYQY